MKILDLFKQKEPKPVVGELVGKGEITFHGAQEDVFYCWVERRTSEVEIDGRKFRRLAFTTRSRKIENQKTFITLDQDITDPAPKKFGETAKGMKSKTRLMGGIMITLDLLVMYFLYLVASSGFVIQYNPQAMSIFIALIGFIVIAFAVLLIYFWYASKVTTFSMEIRSMEDGPIAAALESGLEGIPVYLLNSRRESPQQFFDRAEKDNLSGALAKLKEALMVVDDSAHWKSGESIHKRDLKISEQKRVIAASSIEGSDDRIGIRPYFFTTRSWLPVVISLIMVAAGFIILYFVYG